MLHRLAAQWADDEASDDVGNQIDAQRQVGEMAAQIDGIPAGDRAVLLLFAWDDLSYEEIALALDIPVGTVRSRLHRTRRRLRAGVIETDAVTLARPDGFYALDDIAPHVLNREKEKLMQMIEGKTKVILDAGDGTVLVRSKDDITAGDGAKHDVIAGKGAASTTSTSNIFQLLTAHSVPNHFVEQIDPITFRARKVEMIPIELVARRVATGSYVDRNADVIEGTWLSELVFEVFEKDDENHDPLLEFDFQRDVVRRYVANTRAAQTLTNVRAGDLIREETLSQSRFASISPELLDRLRELTIRSFEIVEHAWAMLGGTFWDVKIECGVDVETRELLVADVIDSDSGRLRFGDKDVSKQAYRDGSQNLRDIKKNFDDVAEMTKQFT